MSRRRDVWGHRLPRPPQGAELRTAWNSEDNLSIVIVRHPYSRLGGRQQSIILNNMSLFQSVHITISLSILMWMFLKRYSRISKRRQSVSCYIDMITLVFTYSRKFTTSSADLETSSRMDLWTDPLHQNS